MDHKGLKVLKGSKVRKEEDNQQFMDLTIGHGSKKVFSMVRPVLLQQTMIIL